MSKLGEGATPGPWEVLDSFEATLHNDSRVETVFEVTSREQGNTPCYATSYEHARFIAKAPLLIEARDVLTELNNWAKEFPALSKALNSTVLKSRALLAKLDSD